MLSEKKLAKQRQLSQIAEFKLGSDTELTVAAVSMLPFTLFSKKTIHYNKTQYPLSDCEALHYIKKDGKTDCFVWHARPQPLNKARLYGLLQVESPLAQAISALGHYRQTVLARIYDKGIISNKYEEKEAIVRFAQHHLSALLPLEQLANTYDHNASLEQEKARVKKIIRKVIKNIDQLERTNLNLSALNHYDKNAVTHIKVHFTQQKNRLELLSDQVSKASADELKDLLKATGPKAILTLVKTMGMTTLLKAQELNQNITYSRRAKSLLRGDLNNAIEDALKSIRDFEADAHHPILAEHQGLYETNTPSGTMAIDFAHLKKDAQKTRHTLQAIRTIYRDDVHALSKLPGLKTTRFTKWKNNASRGFALKRLAAAGLNILTGTIIGLSIDLPLGFLSSFFSLGHYKLPSLAEKLKIEVDQGAFRDEVLEKNYYNNMHLETYSVGAIAGQRLGSFLRHIIRDVYKGVRTSLRGLKFNGFDEIIADAKTGAWAGDYSRNIDSHLSALARVLFELAQNRENVEKTIEDKENEILGSSAKKEVTEKTVLSQGFASAPYHLNAGDWDDLLNFGISGVININDTFVHNIHAKHPFIGLLFTGGYAAGGLSILVPGLAAPLPPPYIKFSHALANLLSKGTLSQAITTGFSQGKLFAAGFEAILHGPDSWLSMGLKEFEDNPASVIIYTAMALGMGYTLSNVIDIPGLSQYIQEDVGTVPSVGWAFVGGKISIILLELLEVQSKPSALLNTDAEKQLRAELKRLCPELPETEIQDLQANLLSNRELHRQLLDQKAAARASLSELEQNPTTNIALDVQRLQFISMLYENQQHLEHMDGKSKREIIILARHLFNDLPDKAAWMNSVKNALYPAPKLSIFVATLKIILDYIPLLLRCMASPVTLSTQPWRDLTDKVVKDLTRVAHGASKLFTMLSRSFVRVAFRGVADVVSNEMIARTEGLIRNNEHQVSGQTYKISASTEKTMETLRQTASIPVDHLRKTTTSANLSVMTKKTTSSTLRFFNPNSNDEPREEPTTKRQNLGFSSNSESEG